MKKRFLVLMLSIVAVVGAPAMTVNAETEEVVIPEYTTVDYDVDFQYELNGIDALKETCDQQGTVESLTYEAPAYATNELLGADSTIEKTVQVYLPYGYDESKQYNVLYLLHGTGGNDEYWFKREGNGVVTCNVLDNMIKDGLCDPVIVVTPNFYSEIMDKDHKISDYKFYTKKIDSITQFTDYDTNTTINYTDEKKISIDLIKDVDDNKKYDGYISILLYDKNKLVDVINKKATLLDLKTNKTFDIDHSANNFKLICRFWEN